MPVGYAHDPDRDLRIRDAALRGAETLYEEKKTRFMVQPPKRAYEKDRSWNGFLKLGELCDSHGWDPQEYVRFCMNLMAGDGQFAIPSDMTDSRMVSAFEKASDEDMDKSSPESDWNFCEQELYKRAGDDMRLQNRYLMSPLYGFPAWYRYLKGSSEVRSAWARQASEDVASRKDLKEWILSKFPIASEGLV